MNFFSYQLNIRLNVTTAVSKSSECTFGVFECNSCHIQAYYFKFFTCGIQMRLKPVLRNGSADCPETWCGAQYSLSTHCEKQKPSIPFNICILFVCFKSGFANSLTNLYEGEIQPHHYHYHLLSRLPYAYVTSIRNPSVIVFLVYNSHLRDKRDSSLGACDCITRFRLVLKCSYFHPCFSLLNNR